MKKLSDTELIQIVKHKDNAALNELMGRYKQRLYMFAFRYVGDEAVAFDIVQETFTKLYFSAGTYKPEYKFSTWLFQIALNLCRDYGRKKKLEQFFSFNDDAKKFDIACSMPNPEAMANSSQAVQHINHAIEALPHKLKTALILFAIEENSQEDCAAMLKVTAKTIETRVYRARKLLAEKIFKK